MKSFPLSIFEKQKRTQTEHGRVQMSSGLLRDMTWNGLQRVSLPKQ